MAKLFSKTWSEADYDRIQRLISMATESEAAEVEIEADGVRVMVRKHVSVPATQTAVPVTVMSEQVPAFPTSSGPETSSDGGEPEPQPANGKQILAPTPGTFYSRPSPDADPFVQIGDHVSEGQTVCIVEAMKLMNEVDAEFAGTLLEILVSDGDGVEYDQPLMVIDPA